MFSPQHINVQQYAAPLNRDPATFLTDNTIGLTYLLKA